ncbi:MAG: thioredoxin family protein [Candidatus Anstonellaceae archaeon]
MVSPYIKAALLTAALTLLGFFFISQLDAMRAEELQKSVDELIYQSESERLLFLYSQAAGNQEQLCLYFSSATKTRAERAYLLAEKIRQYEQSNVLNSEYEKIRNQYYLSNAALYINLKLAEKYCKEAIYPTILFFYKIYENCPDCIAQGRILDSVRQKYPQLRVFAFPYDTDLPFLEILVKQHNITTVPSLVIKDQVLVGLQDAAQIEEALK